MTYVTMMNAGGLTALTLGAALSLTACKSGSEAPTVEPAPQTEEGSAEAPAVADEGSAEAELAPTEVEEAAPFAMTAVPCTMTEGTLLPEDMDNPRISAFSFSNGAAFAQVSARVDGESYGFIQKYDVSLEGGACTLTVDATFANEGRLEGISTGWGSAVVGDFIVTEVGNDVSRVFTTDGVPVEGDCNIGSGYVTADPQGNPIIGVNDYRTFTVSETGCEPAADRTHDTGERLWEPVFLDGDIISYTTGGDEPVRVGRVKPDGTYVWRHEQFGEGDDARGAGFQQALGVVGDVIVMGPGNPRAITAISPDGELLGTYSLAGTDAVEGFRNVMVKQIAPVSDSQFLVAGTGSTDSGLSPVVFAVTIQ